ncbi:MAG: KH domain-containing protein, partial [Thermoanaerobaculia bacterium]|nr:KH domain-containing protein [Thermoanaerobaculia bacterium]
MQEEVYPGASALETPPEGAVDVVTLPVEGLDSVLGARDENLRKIERALGVRVTARGEEIRLQGPEAGVATARHLFEEIGRVMERGLRLSNREIETALRVLDQTPTASLVDFFLDDAVSSRASRLVA